MDTYFKENNFSIIDMHKLEDFDNNYHDILTNEGEINDIVTSSNI
jgi:hypothetical protein